MPRNRNSDEDGNDLESVGSMADRLKLKGKARQDYIHKHMTGLGYRPRVTYDPPGSGDDDDEDGESGGFF